MRLRAVTERNAIGRNKCGPAWDGSISGGYFERDSGADKLNPFPPRSRTTAARREADIGQSGQLR